MNNLHRELAPISAAAWAQIEEEASRTLKRHLGARRVVDVPEAQGYACSAINTGHVHRLESPGAGVQAVQRKVLSLVELRVPFTLTREAIDDVERGAQDSDWDPVKEAAKTIAFAEDRAVFHGYAQAGIQGIGPGSSNPALALTAEPKGYPGVIATALNELRLAGVNGPYTVVLGTDAFKAVSGGSEDGYPVYRHIERMIEGKVIWAPAIEGGFVLSTRGGDFELDIGQDFSIGYTSHTADSVELYIQESFTFQLLTAEAAVLLTPPA
ncbi:bacteriocin family protein [Acetobacter sp. TBRC 12305]|uniref:Bacteriocin family protein n=1 Tax=Acetobacter garciniae TaxID=2817435 RepID=A0A939HQH2_9PROT|nr:family 1 encapsulin nanocompartment shell protein [Acetobacter garciniae]MBO1326092.1 bacteriocin family protein [Acetobacter garciniae]MBX0345163.1 bacteriocin family protein [Acetobacter garciniae]